MFKLKNRRMPFNWVFAMGLATAMSIIGVTIFAGDDETHACSCIWRSPSEAMSNSTVVFSGEVLGKRRIESGWFEFDHYYEIEFRVNVVWKGMVNEVSFIYTLPDSSSCGGWPWFEEEQEYVIYARYNNPVQVFLCDHILVMSEAQEDLEFLGEGMKPDHGSVSPTWAPPLEPTPEPTPTPTSTPVSTPTPTMQNESEATGRGCNLLARSSYTDFGALPLGLVAGIAWFGVRKRRRR